MSKNEKKEQQKQDAQNEQAAAEICKDTAQQHIEKLEKELLEQKEAYLRLLAEFENYKKRTTKEKEALYHDCIADVVEKFLPVLDNMQRADLAQGDIDALKKGVEMVISQFAKSLLDLKVEEIATDVAFDANMHNAVMTVEDESLGEKQIVEVFQKGYKIGEKIIRYPMVKVAN